MAIDWNMVSAIVAIISLPIVLAPSTRNLYERLRHWFVGCLAPSKGVRQVLRLNQFPDGSLHTGTNDNMTLEETKGCMVELLLARYFDRAWNSDTRRRAIAKTPLELGYDKRYVQVTPDVIQLLKILEPDVQITPRIAGSPSVLEAAETVTATLSLPDHVGSLLDRLGRFAHPELTKEEAQAILRGYPPWYRAQIKLREGLVIDFPINEQRDIVRGGWVIAVAQSTFVSGHHLHPTAYCFLPDKGESRRELVWPQLLCLERILQILEDDVIPVAPSELKLGIEQTVLGLSLLQKGYSSRWSTFCRTLPPAFRAVKRSSETGHPGPLTDDQAVRAISAFNKPGLLSPQEVHELEPFMSDLLIAVLIGAARISRCAYSEDVDILPEILSKARYIYLYDEPED